MHCILEKLGIKLQSNSCIPVRLKIDNTFAKQPASPHQLHSLADIAFSDWMQKSLHAWWQKHAEIFIDMLGYKQAVHVHATAVDVCSASVEPRVYMTEKFCDDPILAFHTIALKHVHSDAPEAEELVSCLIAAFCPDRDRKASLHALECCYMPSARYKLKQLPKTSFEQ